MVHDTSLLDGSTWSDEDIVISGISARLPNCDSVEEFQNKLLAKIDLITDEPRRFQNGLYGAIKRYGLLKDLSKFDAKFFNIHPKQAQRMDPQIRGLLEVAFEATVDAGLHPDDLKGTSTGVVVGVASSETQDKWSQMPDKINGFEYTGCTRTMFANRVSHMLDLKGPSYSIDTASSTTLVAFQQAYDMIKDGVCEACFVCGTDLVLNPCVCLMFQCLNMLSPEGKCKAFDISGDGYVRSEGVVAVLLQKAKTAKRVYAKVLAAGSNCDGYKDEGITFPSGPQQVKLFRRVAQLANIDPSTINFMEAHGSATRVGDPQEMNAVTEVFAKNRKIPLRTGSIKSNMGHAEPASALSAVIKVCVAMESGILPPNLHYNIPNPDIPALLDGRLKVITEPTPWDGGLVAVNSFGVGGANGHALLLSNSKIKQASDDNIARLVCISGVTEQAVSNMLTKLCLLPRDPELYALLNNVFRKNINGHDYRGYVILPDKKNIRIKSLERNFERSLCLVFSGFEADWNSIDSDLLNLSEFYNSLKNCDSILKTYIKDINLKSIITNLNTEKSTLNVILGIVALQIGIIDVLRSINILPDFIIGLNIGEIASGYADQAYDRQQAILLAFHIGSFLQHNRYPSAILQAGISRNKYVPNSEISVFAELSSQCTYFSGPKQSVDDYSKQLNAKGITTEKIGSNALDVVGILKTKNVSNLAKDLKKILSSTKKPTKKWLTFNSHRENETNDCVSHLLDSLSLPTPIRKVVNKINKSVILEIGLASNVKYIQGNTLSALYPISERVGVQSFIATIGELYNLKFQPQVQNLYPEVQFPVSHGTPMIQSMVEWDHSDTWNVVSFAPKENRTAGEIEIVVDFDKEEYNYLPGNYLNYNQVFPKSFYIMLLWKAISRLQVKPISEIALIIENISFVGETAIPEDGKVTFTINVINSSNKFEIWDSDNIVVRGYVSISNQNDKSFISNIKKNDNSSNTGRNEIFLDDIYNDLSVKHYTYNQTFRQLLSLDYQSNVAQVVTTNWCSMLESFFQIPILWSEFTEENHTVVSFVRRIAIVPEKFKNQEIISVTYQKEYNAMKSDGIEMNGISMKTRPCSVVEPKLEAYKFIPFVARNIQDAAEISLQLAVENWHGQNELKIAELCSRNTYDSLMSPKMVKGNAAVSIDVTVYSPQPLYSVHQLDNSNVKFACKDFSSEPVDNNCHIIIASNVLSDPNLLRNVIDTIRTDGCAVLKENIDENVDVIENTELRLVSYLTYQDVCYVVLKKVSSTVNNVPYVVDISNESDWMKNIREIPNQRADNVVIVARGAEYHDILNLVKSARSETKNKSISVIIADDESAPMFATSCEMYYQQLKCNYPVNIFRNGIWGTYIRAPVSSGFSVSVDDVFISLNTDGCTPRLTYKKLIQSKQDPPKDYITCRVYSACLNVYDGENSSDSIEPKLGTEFSGYKGTEKVFGLVAKGALSSTVVVKKNYLWSVPKNWSLEEAATVPYSYAMAYYALRVRGEVQNGDGVLIVGASSIAIASIYVALQYNLNVFVLLSEKYEKILLKKLFPQIKDTQMIVSKRNTYFVQVLQKTAAKGLDLVFDTLSGSCYSTRSYINSLRDNGKLVYFGNDNDPEKVLGSAGNMRCITCHRIVRSSLFAKNTETQVGEMIGSGLKYGAIQPLPYSAFSGEELQSALDHTNEENGMYKTVINVRSEYSLDEGFSAKPRAYFDSDKSYIILGGIDDFGLYVTNWMISRGVRNLVLVSSEDETRRGNLKEIYLHKWQSLQVSVIALKWKKFDLKSCEDAVKKAQQLGPVDGIFDFTAPKVYETKSTEELRQEELKNSLDYFKIDFLRNMDLATRRMCPELNYFVAFTTLESSYGVNNSGISGYANGTMQNIMMNRKQCNLRATLIQWGKVGELNDALYDNGKLLNLTPQPINSCINVLHAFLDDCETILSSYVGSERSGSGKDDKTDAILEGVAKFLGIKEPKTILPTLTMLELGLDSLIGTDIQQFLEMNYGVMMSTQEVRELTFEKLKNLGENL